MMFNSKRLESLFSTKIPDYRSMCRGRFPAYVQRTSFKPLAQIHCPRIQRTALEHYAAYSAVGWQLVGLTHSTAKPAYSISGSP